MKIKEIIENQIIALNEDNNTNLINHYVFITDSLKTYVGEITQIKNQEVMIKLIGEIINKVFSLGISTKPNLNSRIDLIKDDIVPLIMSYPNNINGLLLGNSAIYEKIPIYINLSTFFSSHFLILGGTGSGKSFSFSTIIQNLFEPREYIPYNASIFVFDTYGEYAPSFNGIESKNLNIKVKKYSTNDSPYFINGILAKVVEVHV